MKECTLCGQPECEHLGNGEWMFAFTCNNCDSLRQSFPTNVSNKPLFSTRERMSPKGLPEKEYCDTCRTTTEHRSTITPDGTLRVL